MGNSYFEIIYTCRATTYFFYPTTVALDILYYTYYNTSLCTTQQVLTTTTNIHAFRGGNDFQYFFDFKKVKIIIVILRGSDFLFFFLQRKTVSEIYFFYGCCIDGLRIRLTLRCSGSNISRPIRFRIFVQVRRKFKISISPINPFFRTSQCAVRSIPPCIDTSHGSGFSLFFLTK